MQRPFPAAATLSVQPQNLHDIRVVELEGVLTEQLVYPVMVGDGKRERLEELLQERQKANRTFVIGGFGNSDLTWRPWQNGHW